MYQTDGARATARREEGKPWTKDQDEARVAKKKNRIRTIGTRGCPRSTLTNIPAAILPIFRGTSANSAFLFIVVVVGI
jgi:hypothetical protein